MKIQDALYTSDDGGGWTTDITFDEARHVIGAAFGAAKGGDPMTQWCVDAIEFSSFEEKRDVIAAIMSYAVMVILYQGGVLYGRRNQDGRLECVTCLQKYPAKSKWLSGIQRNVAVLDTTIRLFCRNEMPQFFTDKSRKSDLDRFMNLLTEVMDKQCTDFHEKYGPQRSHIYVGLVAVHPDFHRQGLGKQLMQHIERASDVAQLDLYLECGGSNRIFYEKSQYHCKASPVFEDPLDAKRAALEAHVMVREYQR